MPSVKDVIVRKPTDQEKKTCKTWSTWGCPASEFPWEYTQTEKCLILDGQVTVTDNPDTGDSVSFGPGDFVQFPVGLKCIWKVSSAVKKHYNFE